MESNYHEENGLIPFHQYYTNEFGLIDFMDEANVDHLVDLIRGETLNHAQNHPVYNFYDHQDYHFSHDDLSHVAADGSCNFLPQPPPPAQVGLFEFDAAAGHVGGDDGLLNACLDQGEEEDELLMDEDESSGSGATGTPRGKNSGGGKADRSRTLVSERRRRGRMKEKLYALRSLVPNITKVRSSN